MMVIIYYNQKKEKWPLLTSYTPAYMRSNTDNSTHYTDWLPIKDNIHKQGREMKCDRVR